MVLTITLNPCIDRSVSVLNLTAGGLNRAECTKTEFGGKGINAAMALNNLGGEVACFGMCPGDASAKLNEYIKKAGIAGAFFTTKGNIRINTKITEKCSGNVTEINEAGEGVSENDITGFSEEYKRLVKNSNVVVISGSAPPGTNDNIYYELVKIAKAEGVKTILDADGEKLKNGIKALPYAIKPNLYELEQLAGRTLKNENEIALEAEKIVQHGICRVLVTLGDKGAIFVSKGERFYIKAPKIVCKSPIAAGDSTVAALAYAIESNADVYTAAKLAVAAGTSAAERDGSGVCTRERVFEIAAKLQILKL